MKKLPIVTLLLMAGGAYAQVPAWVAARGGLFPDDFKIPADGTDDAPSIQRTIDRLCSGPGGTVKLMSRHYQINSPVSQKCALHWDGQGWQDAPPIEASAKGTYLDIGTSFAGSATSPITVSSFASGGTSFERIAFSEPGQPAAPSSGTWAPVSYPYVLSLLNIGGEVMIRDVNLHGLYDGISAINAGRTHLDHLYGQAFHTAFIVDEALDNSTFRNIHLWPEWSSAAPVIAWQQANGIGMATGRVDTPMIEDISIFGFFIGWQIFQGTLTGGAGTTTRAHVASLDCDSTVHCMRITGLGASAEIANFTSFGQQGTASGVPVAGANMIQIDGWATLKIGNADMAMADNTIIGDTSTSSCSNIRIANLQADFSLSSGNSVSLMSASSAFTTIAGVTNQLYVANVPAIITRGKLQIFTAHSGIGAAVFYPSPARQN